MHSDAFGCVSPFALHYNMHHYGALRTAMVIRVRWPRQILAAKVGTTIA